MTTTAKQILERALTLAPEERAALLDAIAGSLHESVEVSPAWRLEIARRIQAIERGEIRLVPGDEVESRVLAAITRR